jgi:hypothetical protein
MRKPSRVPNDPNLSVEMRDFLDYLDRKTPQFTLTATTAPTTTDDVDSGWQVGSQWINIAADDEYICLDNSPLAAVWKKRTP